MRWLETSARHEGEPPPLWAVPAIDAWNMMGSQIDWNGLAYVFGLLGVPEPDRTIRNLFTIRDHTQRVRNAG